MIDGSKYGVCHFSLYSDGFEKHNSLSNTKSVHGFYLLPLNLSADSRRSLTSTRVQYLVPYVCSQTQVLSSIFDDVVVGMTHGINGYDPIGQEIRIFLHAIAFYGDYLEVTTVSNVKEHSADVHCSMYTIRRRKVAASSDYTSTVQFVFPNEPKQGCPFVGY